MKNWSGTIRISGINAHINVVIKSKTDWYGSGAMVSEAYDELMRLYYTGRLEKTEIGNIAINGCKAEDASVEFTFTGAGAFLMK